MLKRKTRALVGLLKKEYLMLTHGAYLSRQKTIRGGVIPYTIINGKVYFLLARHGETRDLGDFGGGIKKHEFSLNGSLREYEEESNGIFSVSPNDLLDALALVDGSNMAIIFVLIDKTWFQKAQNEFQKSKKTAKKASNEISEVVWIDEDFFVRLVLSGARRGVKEKLWTRVQNFLKKTDVRKIPNALRDISTSVSSTA